VADTHRPTGMRIVANLLVSRDTHNALRRLICPAVLALTAALLLTTPLGAGRALAESGARCPRPGKAPGKATLHYLRTSVLCLVNRARERYGLAALHFNADLRHSAIAYSYDMVTESYFSHYGPDGSTLGSRVARSGYLAGADSYLIGENIGGGGRRLGSPLDVFRAWMHSPPHRANILDPEYRDFGAGVARGFPDAGSADAATYTLDFGMRR
jgi:uncharacterized protein YkwD